MGSLYHKCDILVVIVVIHRRGDAVDTVLGLPLIRFGVIVGGMAVLVSAAVRAAAGYLEDDRRDLRRRG
jgi:hypothetical protein